MLIPTAGLKPNSFAFEQQPMVKPTGFREYDARWLFGSELNLMGVHALGVGLGTLIHELGVKPEVVTGHEPKNTEAMQDPQALTPYHNRDELR